MAIHNFDLMRSLAQNEFVPAPAQKALTLELGNPADFDPTGFQDIDDRRVDIYALHGLFQPSRPGKELGVENDQRNSQDFAVKRSLAVAERPVLEKAFSVIGRDDDERLIESPAVSKEADQPADEPICLI